MFARIAVILVLVGLPHAAGGDEVVRDGFETPEPVLRAAGGDARHTVEAHQRVDQGVHSPPLCEHLRIAGGGGTAVYYSYPIRPARVIADLAASLWVRADRPGLQIVVRVVLPRTAHPRTGQSLTTLIRGSAYEQVGTWQMLRIDDLERALAAQTRVLRSQFGSQVDPREAYVDLVLLNVYGGPGTTSLWVDDFEMTGTVEPAGVLVDQAAFEAPASSGYQEGPPTPPMPEVELKDRLLVGGEPFFPRVIEHRGEPLAHLQRLGFNCVRIASPTPQLLAEAARLRLWVIVPPPPPAQLRASSSPNESVIGRTFDPVLAWDVGSRLSARDLDAARQWAEAIRWADARGRPVLVAPDSNLNDYSRRPFGILLDRREGLGTSLDLSNYPAWLAERAQLARAGATLWATIPTQPAAELVDQMRLVSGEPLPPPNWQEAQVRSLVHAALAARVRGLYFTSLTRLDAPDPSTRARAALVALLNLELELIARWPSAGSFAAAADTSDKQTAAAVIETDRTRLLLPIRTTPGGQFVLGTPAAPRTSYVVAGVPEGDHAYELTLTGLHALRSARVTGGTKVVLGDESPDSLVVFMQDQRVYRKLKEGVESARNRAVEHVRELAVAEQARVEAIVARLSQYGSAIPVVPQARAAVQQDLQKFDALVATSPDKAYAAARHALEVLRQIERVHWEEAKAGTHPLTSPLTASFATLPAHYETTRRIAAAPRSENRVAEGGCENLSAMLAAGWKHYQHAQPGIQTGVHLTPGAAHSGAAGLLLQAIPADDKRQPGAIETPPVWVTTAEIAVEAGDLVQIQAWVRVDPPLTGGVDGLVVLDTLSGAPLALSLLKTTGWQQITMLRGVARRGTMATTFALSALGTAAIDDVTMQIVQRPAALQPLPAPPGPLPQAALTPARR